MISVLGQFCQPVYFSHSDTPDTSTINTLSYTPKKQIRDGESSWVIEASCSQNKKSYIVKWPKESKYHDQIKQESAVLQYLNAQSPEDPEGKNYIITLIALFSLEKAPILLFPFYENPDLCDLIISKGSLSLDQTLLIGKQLMKALIFLKQYLVIHRDIKPENITITDEGNIKLIDFGFAIRTDQPFPTNSCGTIKYLSPELLKNHKPNFPSDLWAAAYTIYLMTTGLPLFNAKNRHTLKKQQQLFFSNPAPFNAINLPSSSKMNLFKNALNQMMAPDPSKRSSPENGLDLLSEIESLPSDLEDDLVNRQAVADAITDQIIKPSDNNLNFVIESSSHSDLDEEPCCVIQ